VLHITAGTTTVDGLKITNGVVSVYSPENADCCVGGGIAVSGQTAGVGQRSPEKYEEIMMRQELPVAVTV
jgi:hypothetical protein